MIKLEGVNKNKIIMSSDQGCIEWLYLTPKEARDSMKELERGLFAWHELTGEPIDKSACH